MTTNATSAAAARSSAVRFANGIPPSSLRDSEGSARSIGTVYKQGFLSPMMTARTGSTVMLLRPLHPSGEGLSALSIRAPWQHAAPRKRQDDPPFYDTGARPYCHNRVGRSDNIYILDAAFDVSAGFGLGALRDYIYSRTRPGTASRRGHDRACSAMKTWSPPPSLHEKRAACREACSPFPLGRGWPVGYAASSAASSVREVKGVVWPVATFTTSPSQRSLELAPASPSSALYTSVRTM